MAMRKVVLPQAFRNMIPAILNQFIISLKDTSILTVIGVRELTQSGQIIIASTYRSFEIWTMIGLLYFILIYMLTTVFRRIEVKLQG
jgi:polar amino acid transport system permease protein/polar amino acid transport system substrate-binding protein